MNKYYNPKSGCKWAGKVPYDSKFCVLKLEAKQGRPQVAISHFNLPKSAPRAGHFGRIQ